MTAAEYRAVRSGFRIMAPVLPNKKLPRYVALRDNQNDDKLFCGCSLN
jgi:hypothetical protein